MSLLQIYLVTSKGCRSVKEQLYNGKLDLNQTRYSYAPISKHADYNSKITITMVLEGRPRYVRSIRLPDQNTPECYLDFAEGTVEIDNDQRKRHWCIQEIYLQFNSLIWFQVIKKKRVLDQGIQMAKRTIEYQQAEMNKLLKNVKKIDKKIKTTTSPKISNQLIVEKGAIEMMLGFYMTDLKTVTRDLNKLERKVNKRQKCC